MPDPFTNVDTAPPGMVDMLATALELRVADPSMSAIYDAVLAPLDVADGCRIVDVGAGTGGFTRRVAAAYPNATVVGIDPSTALIGKAKELHDGLPNLSFSVGDGAALAEADASADIVMLITVLSHVPEPAVLVSEAARILRPGGTMVILDADFSKASFSVVPGDPLDGCAKAFVDTAVTDPWLTAKLRPMVASMGLSPSSFVIINRVVTEGPGALAWVRIGGANLVAQGVIGQPLVDALEAEYVRRAKAGTLYSFNPFVVLTASKS